MCFNPQSQPEQTIVGALAEYQAYAVRPFINQISYGQGEYQYCLLNFEIELYNIMAKINHGCRCNLKSSLVNERVISQCRTVVYVVAMHL